MTQLVALHGFLGAPSDWDPVLATCPLPWRALRVPFHGRDEERINCTDWHDALAQLAEQAPAGDLVLCGYSLGARLAIGLAFVLGERVRGLISISGHAGLPVAARPERADFEARMATRLESAPSIEAFVDMWQELPLFATQLQNVSSDRLLAQRRKRTEHVPQHVSSAFRVLGTSRMPHYELKLDTLPGKVLWLAGGLDEKYRELAVRYASRGRASYVVMEGIGHNPLLEAPQQTAALINHTLQTWGLV